MKDWSKRTTIMFFLAIVFAVAFILFIALGVALRNSTFSGLSAPFAIGGFIFVVLFFMFLGKDDNRSHKTKKKVKTVRYKQSKGGVSTEPSEVVRPEEKPKAEETKKPGFTPYFEPKIDGTYGWDQNGPKADYSLIHRFADHVEKKFPLLPLPTYEVPKDLFAELDLDLRINGKPNNDCLQKIIRDMERHLGHKADNIKVSFREVAPGERTAGTHLYQFTYSYIHVWFNGVYDVYNVLEILAHEISHAYQHHNGCPRFGNSEDEMEKFTDALAIYLGFEKIYKYGQKFRYDDQIARLGYLSDNDLIAVLEEVEERRIKDQYRRESFAAQKEVMDIFEMYYFVFAQEYERCEGLTKRWEEAHPDDQTLAQIKAYYFSGNYKTGIENLRLEATRQTKDTLGHIIETIQKETQTLAKISQQIVEMLNH